ncbi:MAG: YihA family ribosome biogenesis GTP-binding protein [Acidobacteria bacterium]|nr:YihA family ribosome biogenesis GTP-binding protein [Acidobacteriota bacterium]
MEIKDVRFDRSVLRANTIPKDVLPHLAVAGRSNVGKSSLLNWLCRRQIARVAKAPGKTRMLNFFLVNRNFFLVDLPGYGYAKVHKALRVQWNAEVARYLASEERLAGIMTLIDIRHGPSKLDLELQRMVLEAGRERLVVLTKADKVGRAHRRQMQRDVQHALGVATPPVIVSVTSGEGRKELLDSMERVLTLWRERHQGA